jgi:DNA-binding protein HU-beta
VNKGQLVDALEARLGGKKAAAEALEAVVDTITTTVAKGEKVAITGFGTFEKAARKARTGRNPRTGEAVKIKKTAVPRFRPGTQFKQVTSDAKALKAFTSAVTSRAKSAAGSAAGSVAK